MPRRSKAARLQLKADRRDKRGKITHRATWIIRDNGRDISTGCAADEIAAAEKKLKDYIALKYTPVRRVRHIDDIPIGDVLLSIWMWSWISCAVASRSTTKMKIRFPLSANSKRG